jgi:hypothetical protein
MRLSIVGTFIATILKQLYNFGLKAHAVPVFAGSLALPAKADVTIPHEQK